VAAALVLGGWEAFWRAQGHAVSLHDDFSRWARVRTSASSGARDTVVLLGSSQIQGAIDLGVFAERSGLPRPLQLGLPAGSPLPVLEQLAEDPAFVGIALVEFNRFALYDARGNSEAVSAAALAELSSAQVSPQAWAESRLQDRFQGAFVSTSTVLSPPNVLRALRVGRWPKRRTILMDRERSLRFDHRDSPPVVVGIVKQSKGRARLTDAAGSRAIDERLAAAAAKIIARGGAVASFRIPCSGPFGAEIERLYPVSDHWEPFARRTRTTVLDLGPAAETLPCRDGAHLEVGEAIVFSEAVAAAVVRQVLPGRQSTARR
jgi:hypothetical protein